MSYESTNKFYLNNNNNTRTQQMMMDSNYYNEPPSQSPMTNQYRPSSTSHQTFSPYGTPAYYSSYPGTYEHQQQSMRRTYYNEKHIDDTYSNSSASQFSSSYPAMNNSRFPVPNTNTYQNEINSTSGKILSYPQQTRYPSQSTWPPNISVNTVDSDIQSTIPQSPSCTSMSSYVPDDIESSNSSISDSPSVSNEKTSQKRKTTPIEVFNKLREMGNEQERNIFVDRLQKLWDEHNIICRKLPCLSRQTIDLYRFYILIREQNGFEQFLKIAKNRDWRDIASKLNIPNSTTTAFNLKQKYITLKLFNYECKYDRGGIDPEITLVDIEKRSKNNETSVQESTQPQQVPTSTNQHPISKSISFPLNSVESTTISTIKRRKLTSKDIPFTDPIKLLMSLRGGLLAETTWALDTLNIMLTDDQTQTYFTLKQMPGLLQALVDIYIKCLKELFNEFKNENDQILNNSNEQQEQDSVIYRIESNYLNKYNKQKDIIYEHVYDNHGNIKDNPENVLNLQNKDDLCYIQTHFDPLHMDEDDQEPIKEDSSILFTRYSFGYDQICSRCICVSSIIRNLSFISGNDLELIKDKILIHLLSRLVLLRHDLSDKIWSECLLNIRENTLVTLANISSVLIFDKFDSDLINQLIDGLLYWSTCYSNETQRLSIEILTKLSIHDMNIDFILATPPFSRIISLLNILIDWLNVDNISNLTRIQREFAIVLLNSLIQCDSNAVYSIKNIPYVILLLINFLEDYEIKTNELILQYGLDYILRLINIQQADEILFTTNDMLKRTANCLLLIINCLDNIKIMKKYEDRILNLSISNVIHPNIGRILTDILHYCSLYNT